MAASVVEKEGKQIPNKLGILRNELSQLEKIIDELKVQLQPVLRASEDEVKENPIPQENLVEVACEIRNATNRVSNTTAEVVGILQLLEL